MDTSKRKKTWKRETAWALIVWMGVVATPVVWAGENAAVGLMTIIVPAVFAFATAVFLGEVYQVTNEQRMAADAAVEAPDPIPPIDHGVSE